MRDDYSARQLSGRRVFWGVCFGIFAFIFLICTPMIFESVDVDEVVVIQSPMSGELAVYTTPGYKWQGFGSVYSFKKRGTFEFKAGSFDDKLGQAKGGIPIRFTEGGHATLYGSIQYEMPLDDASIKNIVSNYRSDEAIRRNLIETATNKSIYLSGTLMTSKESYAEKRNDLFHYIADQIQNGIYQTRQKREWIKDPITNQDKEIITAEIMLDPAGVPLRQELSVLNQFKIKTFAFTPDVMPYDSTVETQIKQQQQLAMEVQTSIATKAKAEQDAQTAAAQGQADIVAHRKPQRIVVEAANSASTSGGSGKTSSESTVTSPSKNHFSAASLVYGSNMSLCRSSQPPCRSFTAQVS